jgi:uncharacterized protein YdcH (DUF465 family)
MLINKDKGSPTSDITRFKKNIISEEDEPAMLNADLDSFQQIQSILEGLFHLGELGTSLEFIKERISIDLFHVIDRVIVDIEQEFPQTADKADEIEDPLPDHVILHLFLSKLYERFLTVLNGHIFVIQFVDAISEKVDVTIECYSKREVASAIQNEVKALLYDYLTNTEETNVSSTSVVAIAEMLRDTKKVKNRTTKQIFQLTNRIDDQIKKRVEDACPVTKESITTTKKLLTLNEDALVYGVTDKFATVIDSGHKMLITPSASNILVSFKPTIDFMKLLEKSVRVRLANFKIFLDDFIFNVY